MVLGELPFGLGEQPDDVLTELHVAGVGRPPGPGVAREFCQSDPHRRDRIGGQARRGRPSGFAPQVAAEALRRREARAGACVMRAQ